MYNDCRQIVKTRSGDWASGLVKVGQQVARHVQARQGEGHVRVYLRARVRTPPEPFDVKTEDSGQTPNPKLLGRSLLAFAVAANPVLGFGQLFNVHEFLEAVWKKKSTIDQILSNSVCVYVI